jgi:hypothetical protein
MAQNFEEATKWQQRSAEVLARLGLNADDVARKARDAMNEWRFTWHITDTAFEKIIGDTFPAFRRLLEDFNTWLLKAETVNAFNDIADSIHNWLQDEKNIKAVEDDLIAVGKAAAYIAKGILELVKGFVWLSDNVGPIQAILLTFFGFVVAKAALAQGAILAMNAAIWGTGASLRGVAAIASGLGGIAAFIWGMSPSTANAGEDEAIKKGLRPPSSQAEADRQRQEQLDREKNTPKDTFWDMWTDWVHKHFPTPATGGPDTVEGAPKTPVPGARKSSFGGEGGGVSIIEALFSMFGSWFQGDTAFRPIVVIADEYYTKLVDALRDLLGLGGGHGAGGGGAGGGVATGSGGPHQAGGRFGGMAGGGTGTSGGKGGGGATAGVSLGQMKKLAMDAGFTEEEATIGAAIWMHESSGNPRAIGKYAGELGITQINPQAHGQALANEAFGNPKRAIEIARKLYVDSVKAGHEGFGPWSSYTHGYYKQYLDAARAAKPEDYNPGTGAGGGKISGLNPEFRANLDLAMAAAHKATNDTLEIVSGYRDPEHQRRLFEASDRSGHMVARPGHSFHEKGLAADLGEGGALARSADRPALRWLHEHASEFGLHFPMGWEPWHIEPMGSRGGRGRGGDQMSRTNNIDSEHNVTINVHGSSDPQGTARSVADLQDRRSMIHSRNLRTSIA